MNLEQAKTFLLKAVAEHILQETNVRLDKAQKALSEKTLRSLHDAEQAFSSLNGERAAPAKEFWTKEFREYYEAKEKVKELSRALAILQIEGE